MRRPDYIAILRELSEHRVDFVVVGGVGAVLQGAPVMTFDLDIVHSTETSNVERLAAALESLDACYRMQPERKIVPRASHLASPGHPLLMTRLGPLDVLGAIGLGHVYGELIEKAMPFKSPRA